MVKEETYTASAAAILLGCSVSTITRYIDQGKIKASKRFGKYVIKKSELEPYMVK